MMRTFSTLFLGLFSALLLTGCLATFGEAKRVTGEAAAESQLSPAVLEFLTKTQEKAAQSPDPLVAYGLTALVSGLLGVAGVNYRRKLIKIDPTKPIGESV